MLRQGRYKNNIEFHKYAVSRFIPSMWDKGVYSAYGCGATCLGLLTGVAPHKIKVKLKEKDGHASDKFMMNFLKRKGFTVLPITQCDLTQMPQFLVSQVKDHHVIMVSQLAVKGLATWSVFYNGLVFHNFEVSQLKPLELLNRPLLSAYVIYRKEWGYEAEVSKLVQGSKKAD